MRIYVPAWGRETNENFVHSLRAHLGPDGRQTHRTCRTRRALPAALGPAGILLPVWPLGGAKAFSLTPYSAAPWRNFSVFPSLSCAPPRALGIPPSLVGIPLPVWGSAPKNEKIFGTTLIFFPSMAIVPAHSNHPWGGPLSSPKISAKSMSRNSVKLRYRPKFVRLIQAPFPRSTPKTSP